MMVARLFYAGTTLGATGFFLAIMYPLIEHNISGTFIDKTIQSVIGFSIVLSALIGYGFWFRGFKKYEFHALSFTYKILYLVGLLFSGYVYCWYFEVSIKPYNQANQAGTR